MKTSALGKLVTYLVSVLFLNYQSNAQNTLPRSTPEAEGVSSEAILSFIDAANKSEHELHSLMVLRHGKVVAEGWWNPYRPDLKHTMYSCSKSFTATAIGFAVAEGKLTVNDKVISFFPDDLPEKISPNLAELKVKDLLSMSVGNDPEPTRAMITSDNWVKTFLDCPIVDKPGAKFLYNTGGTYMLSAIVQKVTGQRTLDYLQTRLFDPLQIKGLDWETNLNGINVGGYGLRLKTEDMAKFGQLFLQKGVWKGKQILPAAWIEEASSTKIMQDPNASEESKKLSDWIQGYCYQMWRCRYNAYRADGANGQFIIILPEHDAVIAITSEAPDMQSELNLVWKYLLPAFKPSKLKANAKILSDLRAKLASLATPQPIKNQIISSELAVNGKIYGITSEDKTLESFSFDFKNDICYLSLKTDSATHRIPFGNGKWELGETTKSGPYFLTQIKNSKIGLPILKTAGSYTWKNEKTLELTLRYIESPHTETINVSFDGERATLDFVNIFNRANPRNIHKGIVQKNVANPARLIIRGDDMGYSHSGNEALIKCYKQGIETSIEVIVPSPWFPEAVKMLEQNKGIDVGLHFAITSEWDNIKWRPLTDAPSLRNKDGYFYPMLFHNSYYPNEAVMDNNWKPEDYEKELRAQIEMAMKYIPRLSHVSGHMGSLAFDPRAKEICERVSKQYNLPFVDMPNNYQIDYTGFDFRKKNTSERIDAFVKMLDTLEEGKTYVYVEHPGLDNDELRAISHIGYEDVAQGRQDVTTIFTNEKVKEAIHQRGIRLVSYKEALKK
jgi:CubicO group peptidase (beta-lactamase class C family)/predicted glycoside hydrolase/deacetylase ChbG (UPF0249 family)